MGIQVSLLKTNVFTSINRIARVVFVGCYLRFLRLTFHIWETRDQIRLHIGSSCCISDQITMEPVKTMHVCSTKLVQSNYQFIFTTIRLVLELRVNSCGKNALITRLSGLNLSSIKFYSLLSFACQHINTHPIMAAGSYPTAEQDDGMKNQQKTRYIMTVGVKRSGWF